MIAHRIHSIKDKNDKHAKKYKEIIEHLWKKVDVCDGYTSYTSSKIKQYYQVSMQFIDHRYTQKGCRVSGYKF